MQSTELCRAAGEVVDLMTPDPVTVRPTTSVGEVGRTMAERRFRHMLVSDEANGLLGLVSHRDLLAAVHSADGCIDGEDDRPISELMQESVDTVRPECCAAEAARYMLRNKRSCLPVVNDGGVLVGILTEADFLRLATRDVPPCTCGGVSVHA